MSVPEIIETTTNAPYWRALGEGRLDYQHCRVCGHDWLPARAHCPFCLSEDTEWRPTSGKGRVVSWVVYHKAYAPHLADRIPYNVVIVELAEGPRLLTNVIGQPEGRGLFLDAPVQLQIEEDFGRLLPRFRLSGADTPTQPMPAGARRARAVQGNR